MITLIVTHGAGHSCNVKDCFNVACATIDCGSIAIRLCQEHAHELAYKLLEIQGVGNESKKWICADDPVETCECLYGTPDAGDCTHLEDGRHPRDCKCAVEGK